MKQLIGYLITISILLSQDMLTTKTGKIYEGELVSYSTKAVSFVSGGVQYSKPISTVENLVLEDGTVLIKENKIVLKNGHFIGGERDGLTVLITCAILTYIFYGLIIENLSIGVSIPA